MGGGEFLREWVGTLGSSPPPTKEMVRWGTELVFLDWGLVGWEVPLGWPVGLDYSGSGWNRWVVLPPSPHVVVEPLGLR